MKISLYLIMAQWALLLALSILVITVYRQLGWVFGVKEPPKHGPQRGTKAASFEYRRVSDESTQYIAPGRDGPVLLAFVNPTCVICEKLLEALASAEQDRDLDRIRVLLLISEPISYLQISEIFQQTRFETGQLMSQSTLEAYTVSGTPLVVGVDADGWVRASGAATELSEIRGFVHAAIGGQGNTSDITANQSPRTGRDESQELISIETVSRKGEET